MGKRAPRGQMNEAPKKTARWRPRMTLVSSSCNVMYKQSLQRSIKARPPPPPPLPPRHPPPPGPLPHLPASASSSSSDSHLHRPAPAVVSTAPPPASARRSHPTARQAAPATCPSRPVHHRRERGRACVFTFTFEPARCKAPMHDDAHHHTPHIHGACDTHPRHGHALSLQPLRLPPRRRPTVTPGADGVGRVDDPLPGDVRVVCHGHMHRAGRWCGSHHHTQQRRHDPPTHLAGPGAPCPRAASAWGGGTTARRGRMK